MSMSKSRLEKFPILKTLVVCPEISKQHARIELLWTVGFAFVAIPIVFIITLYTRPLQQVPAQLFDVASRGELMVYAMTVCGLALYNIRHNISETIPDALKQSVTERGTLTVWISLILAVAIISYVVRRIGDINNVQINENLLNAASIVVLIASLTFAYVVLSLKFALNSGAVSASHEQTADFAKTWEAERDA